MKKPFIAYGSVFGTSVYLGDVDHPVRRHSKFRCACGEEFIARTSHVKSGQTVGCGCLKGLNLKSQIVHPRLRHGYAYADRRHSEYWIWNTMKARCNNPSNRSYRYYGAKGIRVCAEWSDFAVFIADMGPRPSKLHSIERLDNNAGYSKDNCVWALPEQQRSNRGDNRLVSAFGETRPAFKWSTHSGISGRVILKRISRGWPAEKAISYPIRSGQEVLL